MDDIRDYLEEYLAWDFETGEMWWKKSPIHTVKVGDKAGSLYNGAYFKLKIKNKRYSLHRALFYLYHGFLPEQVDHINGITTDNRIINLRAATRSENQCNRKQCGRNNTSGFKGVYWYKRKKVWYAAIQINNKKVYIGYFDDKVEAAKAYNNKALELHGEFAKLNEIPNG